MRHALSAIALLAIVGLVDADCRHFVRHHAAPIHHAPYVAPVVHHNVAVAAVYAVPLYPTVGYSADAAIVEELRELRKQLAAKQAEPAPLKMPLADATPKVTTSHVALAKANCAACHSAATAKAKGGGFSLFDATGAYVDPGDQKAGEATLRIASGDMPRGRKMADGERLALIQGLLAGDAPK